MKDIIEKIFKSKNFIKSNECFLSEKDLQFSLALMLKKEFTDVILEYPITEQKDKESQYKYVDIYCKNNKKNKDGKTEYFIELKYKTTACTNVKRFEINDLWLHDHGAYYDNRFYVYRDIARLEDITSKRENCKGYVLFLTNDENYQNPNNTSYPLHKEIVKNKYEHRKETVQIYNNYKFEWKPFPQNKDFEYLLIEIANKGVTNE